MRKEEWWGFSVLVMMVLGVKACACFNEDIYSNAKEAASSTEEIITEDIAAATRLDEPETDLVVVVVRTVVALLAEKAALPAQEEPQDCRQHAEFVLYSSC